MTQLRHRREFSGDDRLTDLERELHAYPGWDLADTRYRHHPSPQDVVVPMRLRHGDEELSMFNLASAMTAAPPDRRQGDQGPRSHSPGQRIALARRHVVVAGRGSPHDQQRRNAAEPAEQHSEPQQPNRETPLDRL